MQARVTSFCFSLLRSGVMLAIPALCGAQETVSSAPPPPTANLSLPDDMSAVPVDEEEDVVETVKLGGEDRVPAQQEGVQQQDTSTPEWGDGQSPMNVPPVPGTQMDVTTAPDGEQGAAAIPTTQQTNNGEGEKDPSRVAYSTTRKNARTMSLAIPAPRGMITDREGNIYACSEVAWQPAIDYRTLINAEEKEIVRVGREVMKKFEEAGFKVSEKTDEQLLSHYKDRRWLALPIGPPVREEKLTEGLRKKVEKIEHGRLMSLYLRVYPAKESACHILGYTGSPAKLPTGPINHNDPIFERREGRFGLEKIFNQQLSGRPGLWRLMFDEQGNKMLDELQVHPSPGHTLVTTLNMKWQKAAEKTLRENTLGRGAFVMVDVQTGEVLVLASVPNYDPNVFIPSISQKDYDALRMDKSTPLVSRAFAGVYPPASTFKTITVAAALRYRVINEHTVIHCPQSIMIGNHRFRNHSSFAGNLNCVGAIVLSNNPFMYQVAATREPRIGAARLCETARRFGYGSTSGLPLADKAGNVPDDAWMYRNYGRGFMAGDAANMAIGQGALLATPLQVAHAISGIANGSCPSCNSSARCWIRRGMWCTNSRRRCRTISRTCLLHSPWCARGCGQWWTAEPDAARPSAGYPAPAKRERRNGDARRMIADSPGSLDFCRRISRAVPTPRFTKEGRTRGSPEDTWRRPLCAIFSTRSARVLRRS